MAPEGNDAFYILVPVPNLKGDIDWDQEKEKYRDKIIEFLDRTVMPELSQNIIAEKLAANLEDDELDQSTISRYLNSLLKNGYVDRVKGKFMKTPKGEMLLEIDEELF